MYTCTCASRFFQVCIYTCTCTCSCTVHCTCVYVVHVHVHMYVIVSPPMPQCPRQETAVVEVENETAKSLLQVTSLTAQLQRLQSLLDQQQAAMERHNTFISQSEAEIGRNNALIERKQTQIDQLNKKITQKVAKVDGVGTNLSCARTPIGLFVQSYMYMYIVHCISIRCAPIWPYSYMELYVYSTLAKRQKGGERNPRNSHPMKQKTSNKRVGHRVPSLENWGGGLKIFCGMPTLPTHPVSKLIHIDKHRHIH